jgi:hypothetical protein
MASSKNRIPKIGDRVSARGETEAVVIYSVGHKHQVVGVKQIGQDFALSTISWKTLTFLDDPESYNVKKAD